MHSCPTLHFKLRSQTGSLAAYTARDIRANVPCKPYARHFAVSIASSFDFQDDSVEYRGQSWYEPYPTGTRADLHYAAWTSYDSPYTNAVAPPGYRITFTLVAPPAPR